jgi:alpha-1,2-mannosyltransferase
MAVGQTFGDVRRRVTIALMVFGTRGAWRLWLIFVCVIAALAAWQPDRTVTHNYRDAASDWISGRPLYAEGVHGFLYFPHAAVLYAPFAVLPSPWGGIVWRIASIGTLAWAVRRLAGTLTPVEENGAAFAVMTCLAIPIALPSARNGQMNLMLAALTTLAFVELSLGRWRWAASWLCLGAAFKPLMIVPMGVAAIAYRRVRIPLSVGAAVLFAAPFFTQHPDYVWQQYRVCARKLLLAGNPGWENPGSDLFGLLAAIGYAAPLGVQTAARAGAGALTVLMAIIAVRRGACRGALHVLALTACYLALFNPRMENNGFVIIAPSIGAFAVDAIINRRRLLVAWLMVAATLAIAFSYQITGGHNFWVCPLTATLVWAYTLFEVCRIPSLEFPFSGASADVAS